MCVKSPHYFISVRKRRYEKNIKTNGGHIIPAYSNTEIREAWVRFLEVHSWLINIKCYLDRLLT